MLIRSRRDGSSATLQRQRFIYVTVAGCQRSPLPFFAPPALVSISDDGNYVAVVEKKSSPIVYMYQFVHDTWDLAEYVRCGFRIERLSWLHEKNALPELLIVLEDESQWLSYPWTNGWQLVRIS